MQNMNRKPQNQSQSKSPGSTTSSTTDNFSYRTPSAILNLQSLVGNKAVQGILAAVQRNPDPAPEEEMVFSLEEALGGEAAYNMAQDFAVSERPEDMIYINMPGFIQGMGYTAKRMRSIFDPLKKVKVRATKSDAFTTYTTADRDYRNALKKGDQTKVAELKTARDAAWAAVGTILTDSTIEGEEGKQARQVVHDYWVKQGKGGTLADDILDPNIIPALKLEQRHSTTVTFDGYRVSSRTYQESRMAYYADVYNYNGIRPINPPAADPNKKTFASRAMQRVYDIHQLLTDRGFGASESKILAAISSGEGSFSTTQTLDRVRFSWGLIQFQGDTLMATLENIYKNDRQFYRDYFEKYGIVIGDSSMPLQVSNRKDRTIAGEDYGVPSQEAQGVNRLAVYDHDTSEWVGGNEGLAVIQRDPRYQALFAVVGEKDEGQYAQMLTARDHYVKRALNWKVTLKEGKNKRKFAVSDVIKNEKTMFALVDRTVHQGNPGFVTSMLKAYCKKNDVSIDDLVDSPDQADIADYAEKYTNQAGVAVRWNLLQNIPPDIPELSTTNYQE